VWGVAMMSLLPTASCVSPLQILLAVRAQVPYAQHEGHAALAAGAQRRVPR
jgi:hypothetical protein